ncbi:helix-turn-helix domain-containing protein [Parahaliea mediterranea]|uniref:Helix-turn-helix domain-containing protein n=1 Tax=Parahaliea mediterranea TaxID=651086 RepID=A0A939IL66_9GAMM|nr:helix-turn-helix domain-containing protein [Parahaliea mediterranea]MBN7796170.1 helix-turn-helix domain-containing protein [Parahaliea mediterranea]
MSACSEKDYETWIDSLSKVCGRYQTKLPADAAFTGSVTLRRAALMELSNISTNAAGLIKSASDDRDDEESHFFMVLQKSGESLFEQLGNETLLSEGDVVLMDQRHPCAFRNHGLVEHVSFHVPSVLVTELCGRESLDFCRKLDRRSSRDNAIFRYLKQVYCEVVSGEHAVGLDCTMDNLVLACASGFSRTDRPLPADFVKLVKFNEVKLTLHRNLSDPDLDVDRIARQNSMSRRQLYRLFQHENRTPFEWIKHKRLQSAKRLLADDKFRGASILEIAQHCGFKELSHFTRSFSDLFGMSPGSYRKEAVWARDDLHS